MCQNDSERLRVMRIIARMNIGGPAMQIVALMRGLDENEFDHRLFTGFCGTNESDFLQNVATDIQHIRIKGFGRRVSLIGDVRAFIFLVREIRSFKPHIIHTHTSKAGFVGRFASLVSFHPSVRIHTYHGHLLYGYFGRLKCFFIVRVEKFLAVFTDRLLAVGEKVRDDLLAFRIGKQNKFGLMPPGISEFVLPEKNWSRNVFKIDGQRLVCAFIGRVVKIKRPDRFLDVVSELKHRGVAMEFIIAGDGNMLSLCRERIKEQNLPVTVLGWQLDIENVLAAADMVVLTSDNEGTPISLIQAGMAGLPVVATNVGSTCEVVLSGISGFLTKPNVQEIADALEKLVASKSMRKEMGAAGKLHTLSKFSSQRLVQDHQNLYKKLCPLDELNGRTK